MSGGTVGPIDEAQLDALVERYEWFTPARILRVLQTGRSDRRVSIAAVSRLLPLGRFTVGREALCALAPDVLIDRFLKEGGPRTVAQAGEGVDSRDPDAVEDASAAETPVDTNADEAADGEQQENVK